MARLIDSSVFIDLERRRKSLHELRAILSDQPFAMASITASELLVGIYRAESARQRRRRSEYAEAVLGGIAVFPFDLEVARTHAKLFAELEALGKLIGRHDLIIAATALTYGYSVLTLNLRDLERVPGLVIQQPDW